MTPAQINEGLLQEILNSTAAGHRYEGVKREFDAAVLRQNGMAAESYRHELHSILDVMLDSASNTMTLTRLLLQKPNS